MPNTNDLRVLKTRQNIKKSFIDLLLVKDFKDITIQNIIDEALIGRSTFYDHYLDKYDLLDQIVNNILEDFKFVTKDRFNLKSKDDLVNLLINLIEYYSKQRNALLALLKVHTESTDLYSSLVKVLEDRFSSYLDTIDFETKYSIPKDFLCSLYAATTMTSIQWCLEHNAECTTQFFLDFFSALKLVLP